MQCVNKQREYNKFGLRYVHVLYSVMLIQINKAPALATLVGMDEKKIQENS